MERDELIAAMDVVRKPLRRKAMAYGTTPVVHDLLAETLGRMGQVRMRLFLHGLELTQLREVKP